MMEDDWGLVSNKYEELFRPQFKSLYVAIQEQLTQILRASLKEKWTVLDFAAGVGEPSRTILEAFFSAALIIEFYGEEIG
jgi:hypothetical protein